MPRIDLVTDIPAEPDACFGASLDVQVHLAVSPRMRIVGGVRYGQMQLDDWVTWSVRQFGIRWRMTSKIVEYDRLLTFTDEMQRGPFGRWRHQHIFEKTVNGTRMTDHVDFASPLGVLGRIVDALVLERHMVKLLTRNNEQVRAAVAGTPAIAQATPGAPAQPGGSTVSRGVRVCGTGTTVIRCDPADVLDFVLDVDRYRQADHKVGRLRYMRRQGNKGQVRHGGRFLGLPAPAATLSFELTPSSRLDFRGVSMPWPLCGFHGSFTCEPTAEGTQVTHKECFIFGPISGRVFRTICGQWLVRDTQAEVLRMKHLLEAAPDRKSPMRLNSRGLECISMSSVTSLLRRGRA